MKINILTKELTQEYKQFLLKTEKPMIYHSIKYRDLLKELIDAEDKYLIASENGAILGALPAFVKFNSTYGNVLNSLPFYGSHGGFLVNKYLPRTTQRKIKEQLLQKFYGLEEEYDCVSSTIITSPFEPDLTFFRQSYEHRETDYRTGQITFLPDGCDDIKDHLLGLFHFKTRNMIRKAYKKSINWHDSSRLVDLRILYSIHKENMLALNVPPKPFDLFEYIHKTFQYGKDYKIFYAYKDRKIIAGLLVLYFNDIVEYFTPAIRKKYRSFQPLSMLIYESMKDSIGMGYKYYNFGGTATSQEGVYRFKSRWGATDLKYFYFLHLRKNLSYFSNIGKSKLLEEYKYFYIVPFDKLEE